MYAPGSTYKPGVAAAALCEGVVEDHTKLECAGVYTHYKSYQPRCWIYHSSSSSIRKHGWINVEEALEVSCNCYFYETGRLLGIDRLDAYMKQFGLGESTGIELSESTGILAGPNYRETNHLLAWQDTYTIVAAIGQSDNAFTPLQLGVYISTLVNGGTRYGAHLLHKTVDFATSEESNTHEMAELSHVNMSEKVRQTVLSGMKRVAETNTTVRNFMKNVPSDVTVAAKTGTAQVGGDEPDNGLFVCCAAEGDMTNGEIPDIVIAAVIERCGGGSYPAMTAARVLEGYYNNED
jgi:penicillin-binding protein 2